MHLYKMQCIYYMWDKLTKLGFSTLSLTDVVRH